jgi:hypothetical protein
MTSSGSMYPYGNPAGCAASFPADLQPAKMLEQVQSELPGTIDLAERREFYIWNGPLGTMQNVTDDPYAYEFQFNNFRPPLTYLGDQVATTFLVNGFVVWFREYEGDFRLLTVPMVPGVLASPWAEYVTAYWQPDRQLSDDTIYPVLKKLPCHWMIDAGYVSSARVREMFALDWHIPNYLEAGQKYLYLAGNCMDADQVAQNTMNIWSASVMCGPLTWSILRDANSFPYRIGSWSNSDRAFVAANPRWTGQPWATFDPETFDLIHILTPLPGYDFQNNGNLYPGDVVYSFSTLYVTPGYFDHIFLVAGIGPNDSRLSITNMIQAYPIHSCRVQEVTLYTPGQREEGVVNHEWNGFGYGRTGTTGFDIFRWKWITYHLNGLAIPYTVHWGDTIETIAFDWKISPESLLANNGLSAGVQLTPGQRIELPGPGPLTIDGRFAGED